MQTRTIEATRAATRPLEAGPPPWFLKRYFFFLLGLLVLLRLVTPIGPLVLGGIAIYALRGPKESVESLTLLAFLLVIDKAIVPLNVSLFRWVILFAAFGRMAWDTFIGGSSLPRVLIPVGLFTVFVAAFSPMASPYPTISIFKGISFAVGVTAILTGFHRTPHLRNYWLSLYYTLGLFILLISLPLYGLSVGYYAGGGFKGILIHSQTFGPLVAPFAAFFTGLYFLQGHRSKLTLIGAGLGWVGIYMSLSRTSFLAPVLGVMIVVFVAMFMKTEWQQLIQRALSQGATMFVIVAFVVVAAVQWSTIQQGLTDFLLKDDVVEGAEGNAFIASLDDSRGGVIRWSLRNFRDYPILGIGFGMPSYAHDPSAAYYFLELRVQTGFMGLPLGASTEKGFMPSAVLEETGIVGGVLIFLLLWMLIRPVQRRGTIALFWMILTCILVNGGEMAFFSMGGNGLFLWLLIGFCHAYALAEAPPVRPGMAPRPPGPPVPPIRPGRRRPPRQQQVRP